MEGPLESEGTNKIMNYEDCEHRVGRACKCGRCAVCGNGPHTAVHGPVQGDPERVFGHYFVANGLRQEIAEKGRAE